MRTDEKIVKLRGLIREMLEPLLTGDCWLLDVPYIRNVGDHLILKGELDFLRDCGRTCRGLFSRKAFGFPKIPESDVLLVQGGGNFGDIWPAHQTFVNRLVAKYPKNRIVVFPQSVCFQEGGLLAETQAVWAQHSDLVVCARDRASYDFLRENFSKNSVLLVPDMALYADVSDCAVCNREAAGTLLLARLDKERRSVELVTEIQQTVRCEARDWPTMTSDDARYARLRRVVRLFSRWPAVVRAYYRCAYHPSVIRRGVEFLTPFDVICTTRLHGLILSLLLGKREIWFLDNSYGKVGSFVRTWLAGVESVREVKKGLPGPGPVRPSVAVTVIVAAHKRPVTLRETLASVFRQRDCAFEVIVLNGIDTPDLVDDVMAGFPSAIYVKDARYLTLSDKHRRGLELAKGEFVFMIDDDDTLSDDLFFRKATDILKGDGTLAFASGTVRLRTEGERSRRPTFRHLPHQVEGRVDGREFFQGFQIGIRKPRATCTTVFRKKALCWGESLIEWSDSALFLKALLWGDAFLFRDEVAVYRIWASSMTRGRGSNLAFKLNVIRQKEALYLEAVGKIADPLKWWCETFRMNFLYFNKSFAGDGERFELARWGLEHAHGSRELEEFCRMQMAASRPAIGLFYFRRRPNFGDLLSEGLVRSLLPDIGVRHGELKDADLVGAGSLLGRGDGVLYGNRPRQRQDGVTLHVWGTGFKDPVIPAGEIFRYYDLDVHAVRGRLTEEVLRKTGYLRDGERPALGDPGLLYPDLIPDWREIPKTCEVAVVPHYYDQAAGRRLCARMKAAGVSAVFVNVSELDPLEVVRQIAAARKVLSSSLHGLIVADAMGLPNRRLTFGGHGSREATAISDFKFRDYYSAFDREPPPVLSAEDAIRDPVACVAELGEGDKVPREEIEERKQALKTAWAKCGEALGLRAKGLDILMVKRAPTDRAGGGRFFVPTLQGILKPLGHRVDSSVREFWHPTRRYDIVHVHWPQSMFEGGGAKLTAADVACARRRLAELKASGVSVVYTRHNEIPHYCDNPHAAELCRLFERESDRVVHMGEFSHRQMGADRGDRDVIIPHHGFDWYPVPEQTQARMSLGLVTADRVVAAVGVYRDNEERELVASACLDSAIPGLKLLSAAIFSEIRGYSGADIDSFRRRLQDLYPRQPEGWITEEDMSRCLAAADVVFLQRVHTLNSGNLPLAFHFGKVVIGPDRGNVGEILRETGNPVFDPEDPADVVRALRRGFELAEAGKGEENARYAREHWNFNETGRLHEELYRGLREGKTRRRGQETVKRGIGPMTFVLLFGNDAETICDRLDEGLRNLPSNGKMVCVNCGSSDGTEAYVRYYASQDRRLRISGKSFQLDSRIWCVRLLVGFEWATLRVILHGSALVAKALGRLRRKRRCHG